MGKTLIKLFFIGIFLTSSSYLNSKKDSFVVPSRYMFNIDNAIFELKTKDLYLYRDVEEIDSLIYSCLYYTVNYSNKYSMNREDLITAIETISLFESSKLTKKGVMPFKSPLFIKSNNAFGIKGRGHYAFTPEYIKGKRKVMRLSFKSYSSFDIGIRDLVGLLNKRYSLTTCKDARALYRSMKNSGYYTAPFYYYSLISLNKKLKKLHKKQKNEANNKRQGI